VTKETTKGKHFYQTTEKKYTVKLKHYVRHYLYVLFVRGLNN